MNRFHRRFERFVYAPQRFDQSYRLFSLRAEQGLAGTDGRPFADAIYVTKERIAVFGFMALDQDGVVFPDLYRCLGEEVLARLSADIAAAFAAADFSDRAPKHIFYEADTDLDWLRSAPHGAPPMLGLSLYDRLFAMFDGYDVALARGMVGDVVDANAGLGDGALLLRRFSDRVDAVSADDRIRRIASRMGRDWLLATIPEKNYALALYLDAAARDVAERANALRMSAPDGIRMISSPGEDGRAALNWLKGALPIERAGYEASGPTGNWMAIEGDEIRPAPVQASNVDATARSAHSPLHILFVLRPSAASVFGGDVVQVQRTAEALRRRGHSVDITMDAVPATAGYDVVHLTNLTSTMETLEQVRAVRVFTGPIVLMPIFMDHADETVWGMSTAAAVFERAADEETLKEYLRLMGRREITSNNRPQPPLRAEPFEHYEEYQREIVRSCDYLIANAYSEVHRIYRLFDNTIPFAIAPSCADPTTYSVAARDGFIKKFGLSDFVLCTGRMEPRKNQLLLTHCLRDIPYPLVLIGGNSEDWYGAVLRVYRSPSTIIIPHLREDELAGAYAAARVLAMPSWDEVVSLSALNGAICEASLVLSRNGYEHEYYGAAAFYCDPADARGIREAVRLAWETHADRLEERRALARRIRAEFTWEQAAARTEEAYYAALRPSPRRDQRLKTDWAEDDTTQ